MSKNVLQKIFNGSTFDEIHPITKASNVFSSNGKSIEEIVTESLAYGVSAGSDLALTVTLNPAPTKLEAGFRLTLKANIGGTGQTLNVNGIGAKAIKKPNGSPAALFAGGIYTLVYDGTSFILQGEGGEYGTATAADVIAGKTIGREDGLVTGTIPLRDNTTGNTGGSPNVNDYHDVDVKAIADAAHNDTRRALFYSPVPTGQSRMAYAQGSWLRVVEDNLRPENFLATKSLFGLQGGIPLNPVYMTNKIKSSGFVVADASGDGQLHLYVRPFPEGKDGATTAYSGDVWMDLPENDIRSENIRAGKIIAGIGGTLQPQLYATGSGTTSTNNNDAVYFVQGSQGQYGSVVTISGLAFRPKIVKVVTAAESTGTKSSIYLNVPGVGDVYHFGSVASLGETTTFFKRANGDFKSATANTPRNLVVTNTSVEVPIYRYDIAVSVNYTWEAWG